MNNTNMDIISKLINSDKISYLYLKQDIHNRMVDKVLSSYDQNKLGDDRMHQKTLGMQEMLFFVYDLLDNYGELK